jgi:hypothetical protein
VRPAIVRGLPGLVLLETEDEIELETDEDADVELDGDDEADDPEAGATASMMLPRSAADPLT